METQESQKEIQQALLQILKEFDRVCTKNHIPYYLATGTCLGAVRHHGFIPWDDDVDVFIHSRDIGKLMKVRDQFASQFFLQSKETDPNFESTILRLRDSSTTCIEKDEQELDINHGLFLDIYPLYEHPEHFFDAHINIIMSFVYRILVAGRVPYNHGTAVKAISRVVLWFYQGECRNRKIKQIKKRLNRRGKSSSYVTYYGLDVTPLHTIQYDKAWFQKPVRMEFEGAAFWGPTDPDAYLTRRYGNYMELPPEEERIPHHSYVIADTKKSYTEYRDAKRNEI